MALEEFELINAYFSDLGSRRADVRLGLGDDCALLKPPSGTQLALTTDTLVCGVHFLPDAEPAALGHKALAVNLSDLASMGAQPAWISLALSLPEVDQPWLEAFSRGMGRLAVKHGVQLIGGDTTRGPLSITIQAIGFLPDGQGLLRSGARVGDAIYVTGCLGDAGLALRHLLQGRSRTQLPGELLQRLEEPQPRVEAGLALRDVANAAIDISDGLLADLGHVLRASRVGAEVWLNRLPLSAEVKAAVGADGDWSLPMASGDDYELCFTLPPESAERLDKIGAELRLPMSCIGEIVDNPGLRCWRDTDSVWQPAATGYVHFSADEA